MLPKGNRLTSGDDIRATIRTGKKASHPLLTIHFRQGSGRFAFVTSKAVGNAVIRNRVRRRARAIVAKHMADFPHLDFVLRFHPGSALAEFPELQAAVEALLRKVKS